MENKLHFADFVVSKTYTKLKVRFNGKEVFLTDAKKSGGCLKSKGFIGQWVCGLTGTK